MYFLLCVAITVVSLIAVRIAIEHQDIAAIFMFFISLICSATPLVAARRYIMRNPEIHADTIANLGIAGFVCFMVGLFFLCYPKGKNGS